MSRARLLTSVSILSVVASVTAAADLPAEKKDASEADKVRISVQAICPVSGQKLGEHGEPVKAKIGKEEVYLCCKACAKKKIDPKHWVTIHANFAKAQKICPVMKLDLPKKPKWTIVQGRIVFVCCPPCIEKIEADPKNYLAEVDKLYAKSIKEK